VVALVMAMGGAGYAASDKGGKGSVVCKSSPDLEGTARFQAPLNLPDGARITKISFYFLDDRSDTDFTFGIAGFFIDSEGALHLNDEIAPFETSSGASSSDRSVTVRPPSPVTVGANEDLILAADFGKCDAGFEQLILHGARVEYTAK
jgi:hypothetical protein